jgi:hypothetical protein
MCDLCTRQLALDAELRHLGQHLPNGEVGELQARRLRATILHIVSTSAVEMPTFRRRRTPAVAGALLLAGALVVLAFGRGASPRFNGQPHPEVRLTDVSVEAAPEAIWARRVDGLVDRVKLERGEIAVHVKLVVEGSRFLVELPDGELEVRGTKFTAAVTDGKTQRVRVAEGRVDLRLRGQPPITVDADNPWASSPEVAPLVVPSAPPSAPAVAAAPRTRPTLGALESGEDEQPYADAMESYESGRFEEAARRFHSFALRAKQAPESEDAAFLEAVSLARAGRREGAGRVAHHFLEEYPSSIHAKDAAVLVARDARARGDCTSVRAVLIPWLAPPRDPVVTRTLGTCDPAIQPPNH